MVRRGRIERGATKKKKKKRPPFVAVFNILKVEGGTRRPALPASSLTAAQRPHFRPANRCERETASRQGEGPVKHPAVASGVPNYRVRGGGRGGE